MTENEQRKGFREDFGKDFGKNWGTTSGRKGRGVGLFYFLGFLGAAIYYVSHATDFWMGVLGLLKSMVWPAFLVYEALNKLGA